MEEKQLYLLTPYLQAVKVVDEFHYSGKKMKRVQMLDGDITNAVDERLITRDNPLYNLIMEARQKLKEKGHNIMIYVEKNNTPFMLTVKDHAAYLASVDKICAKGWTIRYEWAVLDELLEYYARIHG